MNSRNTQLGDCLGPGAIVGGEVETDLPEVRRGRVVLGDDAVQAAERRGRMLAAIDAANESSRRALSELAHRDANTRIASYDVLEIEAQIAALRRYIEEEGK